MSQIFLFLIACKGCTSFRIQLEWKKENTQKQFLSNNMRQEQTESRQKEARLSKLEGYKYNGEGVLQRLTSVGNTEVSKGERGERRWESVMGGEDKGFGVQHKI
jgi:hypothetical protein